MKDEDFYKLAEVFKEFSEKVKKITNREVREVQLDRSFSACRIYGIRVRTQDVEFQDKETIH